MRGDAIFQIYGIHEGREKDVYLGAFRRREEAENEIAKLRVKLMDGKSWAQRCHNKGFAVRQAVVMTDFEPPPRPTPREKYYAISTAKPNPPGNWDYTQVEVFRRGPSPGEAERIFQYERDYRMLSTFEPFRQGDREFALISRSYTKTAVLDLSSCAVVAEEAETDPPGCGFCPVGFYVPDWWDVHSGREIPGSLCWSPDDEWPVGDFGFVWGCHWGDDSTWKVQYLDLSRVRQGVIGREERFSYVELATRGYETPCLNPTPQVIQPNVPPFIRVTRYNGTSKVTFAVEMAFDLSSGKPREWQRWRIEDFE